MAKTILILGGGIMQIPSLKIAKRKGWKVYLADGNPNAIGRKYCDVFLHIDLKDKEKMLEKAREIREREGLDGVFTAGTDFSTTVAWVVEALGLPGIPYEVALRATDKALMREVLKKHNVPIPNFTYLRVGDSPLSVFKSGLNYPLVVKPVDNMGARGVRRVDSDEELVEAYRDAIQSSRSGKVIVEEFMEGPELSIDAIVYKGNVTICGVADRHIYFPPYFVEMGHTMPSEIPLENLREVISVFEQGVKAIGITDGAAKGDVKLTPAGAMIGEIAARLSGGYMSGWTYPYSSGVEVTEKALNIAVGLEPGNMRPRVSMVSAERAFISIPGQLVSIDGAEVVKNMPGLEDLFLRVKVGDDVVFPINNVEKCGNVISRAKTRKDAIDIAEKGVKAIFLRLKPDNPETEDFLFDGGKSDRSDYYERIWAFKLEKEKNVKFIESLKALLGNEIRGSFKKDFSIRKIADRKIADFSLNLLNLPDVRGEISLDWHKNTLLEALKKIINITGIKLVELESENLNDVSKEMLFFTWLFWCGVLKGSVQGGVYIVDTLTERGIKG